MLDCDNPFWKFSLAVYAAPGVAAECLALQDTLNIDVNSLLFVAWLGAAKKIVLSETEFTAIDARVREWHATVVRPLRAVRRRVKTLPQMREDAVKLLRQDIAAVELRAEQIEQAFLFESARGMAAGAAAAQDAVRANVGAMLQRKRSAAPAGPPNAASAELLIAAAIAFRSQLA
jgi:uncharacterized protein (TIGR02444 family)